MMPGSFSRFRFIWLGLLAAVMVLAAFYRFGHLQNQYTYIDELHVLRQGSLARLSSDVRMYDSQGANAFDRAWLFARAPIITYGPGQFVITYALVHGPDIFTPKHLLAARLVACVLGYLLLVLLCLGFWPGGSGKPEEKWALLTALLLLAFSENLILQSRYAFNYAACATATLAAVLLLRQMPHPSIARNLMAGAGLALCLTVGYQLLPVIGAMIAFTACCGMLRARRSNAGYYAMALRLAALGVMPLGMALWLWQALIQHKLGAAIPWWVARFSAGENALFWPFTYWNQLLYLFDQPQDFTQPGAIALLALMVLPALFRPRLHSFRADWQQEQWLALAGIGATLLLFFAGKVPFSPSRHTLHLLPLYVVLLLPVLKVTWAKLIYYGTEWAPALLVMAWAVYQGMGLAPFWHRNRELVTRDAVIRTVKKTGAEAVVAFYYEYDRAVFYARHALDSLGVAHYSYTNRAVDRLTTRNALLISDFAQPWSELSPSSLYDTMEVAGADVEPSPEIFHFPNQVKMRLARPANPGDMQWMIDHPEVQEDEKLRPLMAQWAAQIGSIEQHFHYIDTSGPATNDQWTDFRYAWMNHKRKYALF